MFWKSIVLFLFAIRIPGLQAESSNVANSTYRNIAYYVNWAIYARQFYPVELPINKLTHVLYAFANIKPDTGEVYLSDDWADTQLHFEGDTWNQTGNNLYGCLKQLYLLKTKNRNLKTLLSIGGWTYSSNFVLPASTTAGRNKFASTAVKLVQNLGFDGLDIDWEYPANDAEAANMVLLLQTLREALDVYGQSMTPPYHFELTVACPAGPSNYDILHITEMNQYLDFWNLMAYDFAGSWSNVTADQANLLSSPDNPGSTPFSAQQAISYYTSHGVASQKMILGMPLYGRSFTATDGLGKSFSGVGPGTWDRGVYDYKVLPLLGAYEFYDSIRGSSYSYDSLAKELVSYDNIQVGKQKARWIKENNLGGAMWWESSADTSDNSSLIQSVSILLGGEDGSLLQDVPNQLVYTESIYDNVRALASNDSSSISNISSISVSTPSAASPSFENTSRHGTIEITPSTYTVTVTSLIIAINSSCVPLSMPSSPLEPLVSASESASDTTCPTTITSTIPVTSITVFPSAISNTNSHSTLPSSILDPHSNSTSAAVTSSIQSASNTHLTPAPVTIAKTVVVGGGELVEQASIRFSYEKYPAVKSFGALHVLS